MTVLFSSCFTKVANGFVKVLCLWTFLVKASNNFGAWLHPPRFFRKRSSNVSLRVIFVSTFFYVTIGTSLRTLVVKASPAANVFIRVFHAA